MNQIVKILETSISPAAGSWAPLYLGLIVAQMVYCYLFMVELSHLVALLTRFPRSTSAKPT